MTAFMYPYIPTASSARRTARRKRNEDAHLEVSHVALLVKLCCGKAERVDDVVDRRLALHELLGCVLSGAANEFSGWNVHGLTGSSRVGSNVDLSIAHGDHGAVSLVNDIIDVLELRKGEARSARCKRKGKAGGRSRAGRLARPRQAAALFLKLE